MTDNCSVVGVVWTARRPAIPFVEQGKYEWITNIELSIGEFDSTVQSRGTDNDASTII